MLIPGLLLVLKRLTDAGWTLGALSLQAEMGFGLFLWHQYLIEVLKKSLPGLHRQQGLLAHALPVVELAVVLGVVGGLLALTRRVAGSKNAYFTGY